MAPQLALGSGRQTSSSGRRQAREANGDPGSLFVAGEGGKALLPASGVEGAGFVSAEGAAF